MPPGTTDALFWDTGRAYAHVPEFMGESVLHSWQRSEEVPYMLIGGNPKSTVYFEQKFRQVFPGTIHHCTAKEAEAREVRREPVLGDQGHVRERVREGLRDLRGGL